MADGSEQPDNTTEEPIIDDVIPEESELAINEDDAPAEPVTTTEPETLPPEPVAEVLSDEVEDSDTQLVTVLGGRGAYR